MKLLTLQIINKLPKLDKTDEVELKNKIIICKFFTPNSNWTWYVFEGEKQKNGDYLFFGLVQGFEDELGYFLLSELQKCHGILGLTIERDTNVFCKKYTDLIKEDN